MEYASKGVAGAGLGLGIAGTVLGLLENGVGGILGRNGMCEGGVNHYELSQEQRIATLESQVALRDANIYNDSKMLDMYKYFDGKFANVDHQLCHQAVINAQITANISCMQKAIDTLGGLTKTVIPIDSICPEPMLALNSWVAPTTTPTTGA